MDPNYEETRNPHNPPQAVLNKHARRTALGSFLGPLVVLCLIIGLALLYWARREPGRDQDANTLNPAVGTTGEKLQDSDPARDLNQGGGDPAPRPGSTHDELKDRGVK